MRIAIIVNRKLRPGPAANACAIIGMTIGRLRPRAIGRAVEDAGGLAHQGITSLPVPILAADEEVLKRLFLEASKESSDRIVAIPFSETARVSRTYDEYEERLSRTGFDELSLCGLGLCGDPDEVRRLTSSLALF